MVKQQPSSSTMPRWMATILLSSLALAPTSISEVVAADYGVDVSWPAHHAFAEEGLASAEQRKRYQEYMEGCFEEYTKEECEASEALRLKLNRDQPTSMTNFTTEGYAVVPAPTEAFEILNRVFHRDIEEAFTEEHDAGDVYNNHWESDVDILDAHAFLNPNEFEVVENGINAVLEEWTNRTLDLVYLYGIRVFTEGALVAPHVLRLPLMISALVHVEQSEDLTEPWIVELIGHDGMAKNISLAKGEMLMYESHSIIQARPYPLVGEYMADVILYYEVTNHTVPLTDVLKAHYEPEDLEDSEVVFVSPETGEIIEIEYDEDEDGDMEDYYRQYQKYYEQQRQAYQASSEDEDDEDEYEGDYEEEEDDEDEEDEGEEEEGEEDEEDEDEEDEEDEDEDEDEDEEEGVEL